ncbi:MAG: hypothetical protein JW969_18020, partial [Spirochaetales bacterium]|nr:hypothetical protein [Spirochaetales bacterium]
PASVQLFIMSDDPFGRKGVNVLNEIVKSAGNSLKWDVRYFAEVHPNGNIKSLYGPGEVEEDEVRLLVKKYFPDKYLDFLVCRSKAAVATQYWQKCAREIGIDTQTIVEAYAVGEGAALLRADVESQPFEMKNYPSPTWLINNRYIVLGVNKDPVLAGICKYNSELGICGK